MNCKKATKSYESWLAKQTPIIPEDLQQKHEQMSGDVFSFMRATFYRWVELWENDCAELAQAPAILGVGDLHVENFGTWRDPDGRLVWGINDFDEAFTLPYTNDLVRLAVSAHLAISAAELTIDPAEACDAIVEGYSKTLAVGGLPFVLAERHAWLREAVTSELRDPVKFWNKLVILPTIETKIPRRARKLLEAALPDDDLEYRVVHRIAGLGSLGRQRYTALVDWRGGLMAREAKALVPSTYVWAQGRRHGTIQYETIVQQAVRCPDPSVDVRKDWVVRRLAPDCSRVELKSLPKDHAKRKLLEVMGRETANVHLGSGRAIEKVKRDLSKRPKGWLHSAALAMVKSTMQDWESWNA
jgi:uncharacterized protein DUF2252